MYLTLNAELKKYFFQDEDLFTQIMTIRGEIFREVQGRCTQRIVLGDHTYFLKQHYGVGWKEIFKNFFQLNWPVLGAKNEWLAIKRLQELGIPTMDVVGYGCRGINPARLESFILTRELTDTISLEDYCRDWHITLPPVQMKRKLIRSVADIARKLHENGVNHRDFYLCHFLLKKESLPQLELFLIDLHRAQVRQHVPERWVIKDVAGLYFSSKDIGLTTRDLLRFVREYRQQPLRTILLNEKIFWQKVKQRGDKLYQRHST
ncbi:MAG: lipopolysaccharide core heptose(I) kinase RfaP [Gammaproteobacteria bacterium]|nr:lipopolysaccharide core heptose(I) kinase RfaP [Gammaproteobacteria bacterium]